MPWYPVKDYGDFSMKFQWRDSATGSNGNGGAFVRFPNPAEAVTRTAATRYPCQVGSGQTDPAWVAIYCGHEIQINDSPEVGRDFLVEQMEALHELAASAITLPALRFPEIWHGQKIPPGPPFSQGGM